MEDAHLYVALSGAIPAVVAMWLVDRLDAKRPEPLKLRIAVSVFGGLAVVPAVVIQLVLTKLVAAGAMPAWTYQGASYHAFPAGAAVEELCKIIVVLWVVWSRPEFDERMDGIVYASRAGLGFALVESIGELFVQTSLSGQLTVWMLRAVLAVPGHAMWTGIIGALAAKKRFDKRGLGLAGGYLLAVALHGTYDLALYAREPLRLEGHPTASQALLAVPVAILVASFVILRALSRSALELDDQEAVARSANGRNER